MEASQPLTVDHVAEKTKAEPGLTGKTFRPKLKEVSLTDPPARLLRYLAAIGVVAETSRGQYSANQTTRNLTEKVVEAGISH